MNDNLSVHTASSLMGHSPYSTTLKKYYAGEFEQVDLSNLTHTGETTFAPTMSALLKPHVFRIMDIKRYNLTLYIANRRLRSFFVLTFPTKKTTKRYIK